MDVQTPKNGHYQYDESSRAKTPFPYHRVLRGSPEYRKWWIFGTILTIAMVTLLVFLWGSLFRRRRQGRYESIRRKMRLAGGNETVFEDEVGIELQPIGEGKAEEGRGLEREQVK